MAGNKYNIIIAAALNKANLYQQIKEVEKGVKPITIPVSLGDKVGNANAVENQLTRWKNKLSSLEALNPKIFSGDSVKPLVTNFENLMKTYDGSRASRDNMVTEMNNITTAFGNQQKSLQRLTKDGDSFTQSLTKAAYKMFLWKVAGDTIFGTIRQLRDGIQFIQDLNSEINKIQIVTGMANETANNLGQTYSRLASQLGVTTKEVAQGSLEWFRQGKTIEETNILVKDSMMLSKLGNLDAAQSTEYLTSTLNGFNLEAKDALGLIDKMVALDNAYATSVGEIASALQRSSNSARQNGITFDELASYITVVSATTRKSAESIGESFKTMFTRMTNVKLGKMFEDEAININDVEKALTLVNIKIRDSETSFRPMGDVLNDIGDKWANMDEIEQSAVANSVAGIRQRENFMALMLNYNKVLEAQAVEIAGAGLATERYKIYLDSVEASANKATASLELMWQKTVTTDMIKWVYNAGVSISGFVSSMGGLIPVLTSALTILVAIKSANVASGISSLGKAFLALIAPVEGATVAMSAFQGVSTLGLTLMVTGVIALIGTIVYVSGELDRSIEASNNKITEFDATISNLNTTIGGLEKSVTATNRIVKSLEELRSKSSLTNSEQEKMISLQNQLHTLLPEVSGKLDDQGNFLIDNSVNLRELNKLTEEKIRLAKIELLVQEKARLAELANAFELNAAKKQRTTNEGSLMPHTMTQFGQTTTFETRLISPEETKKRSEADQLEYEKYRLALTTIIQSKNDEERSVMRDFYYSIGDIQKAAYDDALSVITESSNAINDAEKTILDSSDIQIDKIAGLNKTAESARDLALAYDQLNGMTVAQTEQLKSLFPLDYQEALMTDQQTGLLYLNIDALKQLVITRAQDAVNTAQQALNLDQFNSILQNTLALANGYLAKVQSQTFWTENLAKATGSVGSATKQVSDNEKAYQDLIKITVDMLKNKANAEKDALKDELDGYKQIIDAKKKILDQQKSESEYLNSIAEKNKELSDIENELLELQFDNSEEAKAKRLLLEADKAKKLKEIDKTQYDKSIDDQKEALDIEYDNYKDYIDDKIKVLDQYLSESGSLTQEAIDLLSERSASFYNELLEWNRKFGTGIDNDIISKWNLAGDAVQRFSSGAIGALNTILPVIDSMRKKVGDIGDIMYEAIQNWKSIQNDQWMLPGDDNDQGWRDAGAGGQGSQWPTHHSGGIVGGLPKIKESEQYAKLLKGEVVANDSQMKNFMNNTLPNLVANVSAGGGTMINLEVNVAGNLDRSVLPEFKQAVLDVVNKAMKSRGMKRGAVSFSI